MKKNKNNIKMILIIALAILLLCTAGLLVYRFVNDNQANNVGGSDGINYDPPTEQEQQAGNEIKSTLPDAKDSQPVDSGATNTANPKSVSVAITDAAQYDDIVEVRSFLPTHYEDGTCTITFTRNTLKVEEITPAYRDATTTICTNPLFSTSRFAEKGDWEVIVSYKSKSTGAQGASAPQTVRIN